MATCLLTIKLSVTTRLHLPHQGACWGRPRSAINNTGDGKSKVLCALSSKQHRSPFQIKSKSRKWHKWGCKVRGGELRWSGRFSLFMTSGVDPITQHLAENPPRGLFNVSPALKDKTTSWKESSSQINRKALHGKCHNRYRLYGKCAIATLGKRGKKKNKPKKINKWQISTSCAGCLWRAFSWKHFFSSYLKFGNNHRYFQRKDKDLAGKLALALPKDVKIAGTSDPALASCLLPDMWRIERGGCYQPTRSWTTSTSTQASCIQKLKRSKHCKRAQRNSMSSDLNERLGAV